MGADVNRPSLLDSETPLTSACDSGNIEEVKLLIELGAKVEPDLHLCLAVETGIELIDAILETGVSFDDDNCVCLSHCNSNL